MVSGKKLPYVFILSWERPIYLWACLDSLYRLTKTPCRFVIADNNSSDPLVAQVIEGFERRGMLHQVQMCEENAPDRFPRLIREHWDDIGEFFVFIEGDITVRDSDRCWLETLMARAKADPTIGSVGSVIDRGDFVHPDEARKLRPDLEDRELDFLIKTGSPERKEVLSDDPLITPHNAPLRLLLMRKQAYVEVGFGRDRQIHKRLLDAGWKAPISTEVVHRHLSLLNIYDYDDYDKGDRDAFFTKSETADGPILILGMHRSGTSALTGSLEAAGLHLGDVATHSADNTKGSRENRAVFRLNEAVLNHNGHSWFDPPPTDKVLEWTEEHRAKRNAILETYPTDRTFGIKDPRMLLLLDGWNPPLVGVRCVGIFRNPASVVGSLLKRQPELGTAGALFDLWEAYNRRLLALHEASPFPLVVFDGAAESIPRQIERVRQILRLQRPPESAAPFFEPSLRTSEWHGPIPESARSLYLRLFERWAAQDWISEAGAAATRRRTAFMWEETE